MFAKHWALIFSYFAKQWALIFLYLVKKVSSEISIFLEFLLVYSSKRVIGLDKSDLQLKEASQRFNIEYRWRPWKRHPCYVWQVLFFPKTNCQDWVWRTLYWCKWVLRWSCHSLSGLRINKQWSYCWKSDRNFLGSSLHVSRGSLRRSVQGLKTRRTSSNCWISFFKVSLSIFIWINIVDGNTFFFCIFTKKKLFRPESPEFQEAFESVYEVRQMISLPKLGMPYSISIKSIKDIRTAHCM